MQEWLIVEMEINNSDMVNTVDIAPTIRKFMKKPRYVLAMGINEIDKYMPRRMAALLIASLPS